jgi:hypothetical protein
MRKKEILFFLWFALCVHFPLYAQMDSVRTTLQAVESKYNSGAYLSAEVEARRLLEHTPLSDTAFVTLHKCIAFSLIAQGKPDIAREHFKSILTIDPEFSLDPVYTSPKILVVFNETKQSFLSSRKFSNDDSTIRLKNSRTSISYRTILFPGWEQFHAGRTATGYIFLGAGVAALGAGISFEILRGSARKEYLAAMSPSDINSKYDDYNRYYKAEIASFVAFAIVYVASEIDVFAFDHTPSFSIQPALSPSRGTTLSFNIRF